MKARLDFVSNSSSSSFVVLADKNTPKIFKSNLLSFDKFQDRFFRRDVTEYLDYGATSLYNHDRISVFDKISFMTPKEFAAEYLKFDEGPVVFSKTYPVLKSDRKLVDKLRFLSGEYDKLDRPHIEIYRRGEFDSKLTYNAKLPIYKMQQKVQDRMRNILNKIAAHLLDAVKDTMSNWKFWYAELDDNQEPAGYKAMNETCVRWGRVFSNH